MALLGGIGAAAIALIGSMGTWVDAGRFSATGLEGDGIFVLLLALAGAGVLAGAFFAPQTMAKIGPIIGIVAGALSVIVCLVTFSQLSSPALRMLSVSAGWGLIMSLLGSLGWTAASIVALIKRGA